MNLTLEEVKHPDHNLLSCLSGSQAYGLAVEGSDVDRKGLFVLPKELFYGLNYLPQVESAGHDEAFFEVGRFMELLCKSNPGMLEILYTEGKSVEYQHPLMRELDRERFLAKSCFQPFVGYAQTQVRKARGLKKKVFNPQPKERLSLLDFGYLAHEGGSVSLREWLEIRGWHQEGIGLVSVDHMKHYYAAYYDHGGDLGYEGVLRHDNSDLPSLSSVPKEEVPVGYVYFNIDAYSVHCREHREYWEWVEKRNDVRYKGTQAHGQGYDAKNMMHTFRLLYMAKELFAEGKIHVHRVNRDELLKIKSGAFPLQELLGEIDSMVSEIENLMTKSGLPDLPDEAYGECWLVQVREAWYC